MQSSLVRCRGHAIHYMGVRHAVQSGLRIDFRVSWVDGQLHVSQQEGCGSVVHEEGDALTALAIEVWMPPSTVADCNGCATMASGLAHPVVS